MEMLESQIFDILYHLALRGRCFLCSIVEDCGGGTEEAEAMKFHKGAAARLPMPSTSCAVHNAWTRH